MKDRPSFDRSKCVSEKEKEAIERQRASCMCACVYVCLCVCVCVSRGREAETKRASNEETLHCSFSYCTLLQCSAETSKEIALNGAKRATERRDRQRERGE